MATITSGQTTVVKVFGSTYRELRRKILNILSQREDDKSFLTMEISDPSGRIIRYASLTDIMTFLEKLEKVLIPIEDRENAGGDYTPVRMFEGCRR